MLKIILCLGCVGCSCYVMYQVGSYRWRLDDEYVLAGVMTIMAFLGIFFVVLAIRLLMKRPQQKTHPADVTPEIQPTATEDVEQRIDPTDLKYIGGADLYPQKLTYI
ncbi:MAG: hypothetical protein Harvfovirus2_74 [Harvfovirus sp.]|uniref:Uncharacterized protein n=1 Tax=Harvfovirus sp. TaxID=2487768 RepID=A0A3G5A215_9VIRU|nr:MAG: hypothetical protein Harvfovirus2_74 [Harvfovirus sp.]